MFGVHGQNMINKSLIIPAAGKSSRFKGTRPKWLLTHPEGGLMVTMSLKDVDFNSADRIYLAILKEHLDNFCSLEGIRSAFKKIGISEKLEIVVLEEETSSQPETVARVIEKKKITGSIFIKDVDSYFKCKIPWNDSVAIYDLNDMDLAHAKNKSYVTIDDNSVISNIVEKQVISSKFCVGGYGFSSSKDFMDVFSKFDSSKEFYISHIIFEMILEGKPFLSFPVADFMDWGTLKEWNRFKSSYSTLFVDIDGVLVYNSSEYFEPIWGESGPIQENIDKINEIYNTERTKIILTTSRNESFSSETEEQLKRVGLKYHQIIYGLYHAKRIIINDYARSNPYKSCDAINIRRNSQELAEMLGDCFKD